MHIFWYSILHTYYKQHTHINTFIGTGKSTVGAHLAYTFAKLNQSTKKKALSGQNKNRCVVYCGSSNISVDVVASM